jgi:hypothetical protein
MVTPPGLFAFHAFNALLYVSFAAATWAAWFPKAPRPLAALFVVGTLMSGAERHLAPLLGFSAEVGGAAEMALGISDAFYLVFQVTFVVACFIDTGDAGSGALGLTTACVATFCTLSEMFSPSELMLVLECMFAPLCWVSPVSYNRRDPSAYRDDLLLCAVKTGGNLAMAVMCELGRRKIHTAASASAAVVGGRTKAE